MSVRKEPKDKPFAERKEGDPMQTMQAASARKRTKPLDWVFDFFMKHEKPTVSSVDQPPQDDLTQFERDVMRECQEMGMTDDEIQKWMKEI